MNGIFPHEWLMFIVNVGKYGPYIWVQYCKRILDISQDAAILCNFLLTIFWANGSAETHLTKEKTKNKPVGFPYTWT